MSPACSAISRFPPVPGAHPQSLVVRSRAVQSKCAGRGYGRSLRQRPRVGAEQVPGTTYGRSSSRYGRSTDWVREIVRFRYGRTVRSIPSRVRTGHLLAVAGGRSSTRELAVGRRSEPNAAHSTARLAPPDGVQTSASGCAVYTPLAAAEMRLPNGHAASGRHPPYRRLARHRVVGVGCSRLAPARALSCGCGRRHSDGRRRLGVALPDGAVTVAVRALTVWIHREGEVRTAPSAYPSALVRALPPATVSRRGTCVRSADLAHQRS